ncbi:MAG TPA: alpha-glucosidase [Candidatus Izemoplasmatales bacterium]|nr:alpha-glucosidase [Candidatus Izemoplasmatales bacterium]
MKEAWWQQRTIYQIYLRSFFDTDGDGIGDLQGVIRQLPYLKSLGVGVLWVSPHYDSPMDDNGYDVRDFYRVSPDYGTMDDFRELVTSAHAMDMKIITDLILNHTSDEHPWFLAAKDPGHPEHEKYHDYYIWQPPKIDARGQKTPPTRWIGWFGSPAWEYNPATDEYYLHIFSKKMPDLNWRCRPMVEDMKRMIRWWVELGIDGFRVDASNHLEKNWDFPDEFPGYRNFSSLPKHHEYLRELGTEIFVPNDLLAIGESGGASEAEALQYAGFGSCEFNMLIQFGHCWADVDNHHPRLMGKWAQGPLDLRLIKNSFQSWFRMLEGKGWNVVYWHNHDQPRVLSHYGTEEGPLRDLSAKMLALSLYFMPGTAIVYQGEEIGMSNVRFNSLSEFRDVEVFTEYQNFRAKQYSHEEALAILRARCRDNARTPMQWSAEAQAGFTAGTPWIGVNPNHIEVNVSAQEENPDSLLNLYRSVLGLRKNDPDIRNGRLTFLDMEDQADFSYLNEGSREDHWVLCNFRPEIKTLNLRSLPPEGFLPINGNYPDWRSRPITVQLRPYETIVFRRIRQNP